MDNSSYPDIFSNEVIWKTLGQFLRQSDFCNLRRVNSHFKRQVDDCLHFQEQSWQSVWMVISDTTICYPQEETTIQCKNIRVAFVKRNSDRIRNLNSIPTSEFINSITKGVQFTIFFEGPSWSTSTVSILGTPDVATLAIKNIVQPIEILYQLKINSFVFGAIIAERIWQDLPKLKYFSIFFPSTSNKQRVLSLAERAQLITNFNFISQNIRSLNIFSAGGLEDTTPLCPTFTKILTKSVATLTSLDIKQSKCWSLLGNCVDNTFPSLKTLKFKGLYSENREVLTSFLENQPLLEHLDMGWDRLPKSVYDIISRKSSKLRTFHIKAKSFGPGETSGDWRFLSAMNVLDNFQMKRPSSSISNDLASFDQIIQALPKLPLRRIYLRGLNHPYISVRHLEEFSNLMELSLMRCLSAINDVTLRTISRSRILQQNLEVFEISLCDEVTNSGILDLVALTAIRKLTIKGCQNVTDHCMGQLHCPKLKYFDLSYNPKVTKVGLKAAVRVNPGLDFFLSSQTIDKEMNNIGTTQFKTSYNRYDTCGQKDTDSEAD